MSPRPYASVIAANVRAARTRANVQQEVLAARMQALGFTAWLRQTVANVEKDKRRVTAEEVLGLALALETSAGKLLAPTEDDREIELRSGAILPFDSVRKSVMGTNDGSVRWDGDDKPLFPEPGLTWKDLDAMPAERREYISRIREQVTDSGETS